MRSRTSGFVSVVGVIAATALAAVPAVSKAPCTKKGCAVRTGDYKGPLFHVFVKTARVEIIDTIGLRGIRGTCVTGSSTSPFQDQPSLTPDWILPGKPPKIGRDAKYFKSTKTSGGGQTTKRTLNLTLHFTTSKKGRVMLADHYVVTTPGGTSDCHGTATETVTFFRAA